MHISFRAWGMRATVFLGQSKEIKEQSRNAGNGKMKRIKPEVRSMRREQQVKPESWVMGKRTGKTGRAGNGKSAAD